MRMKAFRLQQIDKEYDMHLQAWLNYVVQQTKEKGSKHVPVFRKFKDFYDYEKRLKEVEKPRRRLTERQRRLAKLAAITNAKGG